MERMQLQGPIGSLWADHAASAGAAQMPFLALLQGVMGEEEEDGGGRKRHAAFACPCPAPAADLDLLESCVTQAAAPPVAALATRAERRRKRPRPRPRAAPPPEKRKKPEEAETQRMTHIAVERNRRRLMNDHLASLRSLIPSHYIPRGDQATVVGGAIDYVKQLEQQLVALQASAAARCGNGVVATAASAAVDGVFVSPQYTSYSDARGGGGVDVEAMAAVGGHVRVRVTGRRWPGRLVRAVAAMEDLRLAVLHLAVTSVGHDAFAYCFNLKVEGSNKMSAVYSVPPEANRPGLIPRQLVITKPRLSPVSSSSLSKMEEGCEVATADEVATVVHQIFAYAGTCC